MSFKLVAFSEPFLWMIVAAFALTGAVALVATKGAHASWAFFLAIAALAAQAAVA